MTHDTEIINHLQFVRVTVRKGVHEHSGYLTEDSGKMLLVELRRHGLEIVKAQQ